MKAIVYRRYGSPDVLHLEEMATPAPKDNEILLRVRAAAINPADYHLIHGPFFLMRVLRGSGPKIPGFDVAGEVEAVGSRVTDFKPGDAVFGLCRGSLAEYASTRESKLVAKPAHVSFEQAAAAGVAAFTALQGLRNKGRIQPGQKVLITAAAGGVGSFAVQIAKSFGAEVTAVCSTQNVEMVRSLGADRVIDRTREDFTQSEQRYDLILDCYATHPFSAVRRVLAPRGRYVVAGGPVRSFPALVARRLIFLVTPARQKFIFFLARSNQADLNTLRELMEAGKLKSAIDRRYRLDEAREALRYLEEGHARGKVVITVN